MKEKTINNSKLAANKPNEIVAKKKKGPKRDVEIKRSPWYEEYMDCFTFQLKPVNQTFIDRLSLDLVTWAKHDDNALKIAQFFTSKDIPSNTYYDWVTKHPKMKLAHQQALELIGVRREIGALKKELDVSFVAGTMPIYDEKYKAMIEWKAKLKAEAHENSGTKIVVMEKFASSDLVPERKKK